MGRRFGRFLRLSLAAILVLLWLAIGVLWIRSYWRGDQIVWQSNQELPLPDVSFTLRQTDQVVVISGRGGICLATRQLQAITLTPEHVWEVAKDPEYPKPWAGAAPAGIRFTASINLANNLSTTLPSSTITFNTLSLTSATPSNPTTAPVTISSGGSITLSAPMPASALTDNSGSISATATGPGTVSTNTGSSPVWTTVRSGRIASGGKLSTNTYAGATLILGNVSRFSFPPPPNPPTGSYQFLAYSAGQPTDWLGRAHVLIFPFWALMALMTVPMLLAIRGELLARRKVWRARHGLCANCGYDLRASPERCPECGVALPPAKPV